MTTRPRPSFPARLDRLAVPAARAAPLAAAAAGAPVRPQGLGLDSQAVRLAMVQKIAAQGIRDARVLDAMGRI
jgi:protein-L-isoaspartate(D-aspartate) O-methyltransferase